MGCWVGLEEQTAQLVPGHGDLRAELGSVGGWVPGLHRRGRNPGPLPLPGARKPDSRLILLSSSPSSTVSSHCGTLEKSPVAAGPQFLHL